MFAFVFVFSRLIVFVLVFAFVFLDLRLELTLKSLSWRPLDYFAHLGDTVVCVGIYVLRFFVFVTLFLDLRLELKSCTLRGRGIVSHTLMTSLKGHGGLQNVPPHVLIMMIMLIMSLLLMVLLMAGTVSQEQF